MLETHIATRKDHRCDACGRRIPVGSRYFSKSTEFGYIREHTNCEEYVSEPLLRYGYNHNRSLGEVKYPEDCAPDPRR